jgi:hypothetical protein
MDTRETAWVTSDDTYEAGDAFTVDARSAVLFRKVG